ncbi:hypothetical protein [Streptomyces sp. NPDC002952]|uniref:hypothetical protein n=1 Tax=Streptomyces sp. NPDC002952 TaxID=3364673 RepID=UPI003698A924
MLPPAMSQVPFCFTCWPGGPVTPPPCLRCGSRTLYYSGGLCVRCHQGVSPPPDSCTNCLAWGATRRLGWLCRSCTTWSRKNTTAGACRRCTYAGLLDTGGLCRLCTRQPAAVRTAPLPPGMARAQGQQLFITGLLPSPRRVTAPGPAPAPAPAAGPAPPPSYRQDPLFHLPRSPHPQGSPRQMARGADPDLAAWAEQFTRQYAARCGWHCPLTWRVRTGVNAALSLLQTPGAVLTPADILFLTRTNSPHHHVSAVLTAAGLLEGDRMPAAIAWAHEQIAPLPTPMADEIHAWLTTMHRGRSTPPRRLPRSAGTIRSQLRWSLPALTQWAAEGKTSLREVTPHDVRAALPAPGPTRARMGEGLRSLFTILKDQHLVFTNPAYQLKTGSHPATIPLPLPSSRIRDALHSADPAQTALCALIAFHALTIHQLQRLKLTDLTSDGHLTLGEAGPLPLAAPARDRLGAYLAHRHHRWPATGNPYVFINRNTAFTTTAQVTNRWIDARLGPHLTATALRQDRLLDEAHATDGDPKHLTTLFGLRLQSALRYTGTVAYPALDTVPPGTPPDGQPSRSEGTTVGMVGLQVDPG